jgi:acylphosphatase
MIRYTIQFHGHVQGVGFRYTACNIARGYAVAGYVKNLPDRRVELVAEGDEASVRAYADEVAQVMERFIRNKSLDRSPATGEFGTPTPGAMTIRY